MLVDRDDVAMAFSKPSEERSSLNNDGVHICMRLDLEALSKLGL
jgi:hypothetical protein